MIQRIFITFQFKSTFPKLAFIDIFYYKINSSKLLTTQLSPKHTNKAKIKYTFVSALAARCELFFRWRDQAVWPTLLICITAQALRTFHFSFPLLKHGPSSYSFNLTFASSLYFVWRRVARIVLINFLCKKFVKLEARSFSLDLLIFSITLEMLLVMLLFESVSWCCVLAAIAVVPVPPVFWLCELRVALIRSSIALFNVITGTHLCRYIHLGANLKRKRVHKDSRKG